MTCLCVSYMYPIIATNCSLSCPIFPFHTIPVPSCLAIQSSNTYILELIYGKKEPKVHSPAIVTFFHPK